MGVVGAAWPALSRSQPASTSSSSPKSSDERLKAKLQFRKTMNELRHKWLMEQREKQAS